MKQFGKSLIVINLVAAIAFMAIAVVVRATHVNWRDLVKGETAAAGQPPADNQNTVEGLDAEIKEKDAEIRELDARSRQIENESARLEREYRQRLAQLAVALSDVQVLHAQLETAYDAQATKARELIEKLTMANMALKQLEDDIVQVREMNAGLVHGRDEAFTKIRELESAVAQHRGVYERLIEQNSALKVRVGQYLLGE